MPGDINGAKLNIMPNIYFHNNHDALEKHCQFIPADKAEDPLWDYHSLEYDCFISVVIIGRRELEEGPLGESPLYRVIEREGIVV